MEVWNEGLHNYPKACHKKLFHSVLEIDFLQFLYLVCPQASMINASFIFCFVTLCKLSKGFWSLINLQLIV